MRHIYWKKTCGKFGIGYGCYKLPDDPWHKFASQLQIKSSRPKSSLLINKLKPIATSNLHCNDNTVVHVMIDFDLLWSTHILAWLSNWIYPFFCIILFSDVSIRKGPARCTKFWWNLYSFASFLNQMCVVNHAM